MSYLKDLERMTKTNHPVHSSHSFKKLLYFSIGLEEDKKALVELVAKIKDELSDDETLGYHKWAIKEIEDKLKEIGGE